MIIVISGPSGVGKSTIIKNIKKDTSLYFCISSTTRTKRPEEKHGVDYNFVSDETFTELISSNLLVEHEEYGGNRYGTTKDEIDKEEDYKAIILDLEVNGALNILNSYQNSVGIFIDINNEILKDRLINRGNTDELFIKTRLELAKEQREYIHLFKYHVLNNDLDITVKQINDIIYNGIL